MKLRINFSLYIIIIYVLIFKCFYKNLIFLNFFKTKMNQISNVQVKNKLNELNDIIKLPRLYLVNFFFDLRNNVDKEMLTKQFDEKINEEKKKKLNEIWQQMIAKIYALEKECINNKLNLDLKIETIRSLQTNFVQSIQHDKEYLEHDQLINTIFTEENSLRKLLHMNKTIIFWKQKLIIVNDEFLTKKSFEDR